MRDLVYNNRATRLRVNETSCSSGWIHIVGGRKLLAALNRFTNLLGGPAAALELVLPFYSRMVAAKAPLGVGGTDTAILTAVKGPGPISFSIYHRN